MFSLRMLIWAINSHSGTETILTVVLLCYRPKKFLQSIDYKRFNVCNQYIRRRLLKEIKLNLNEVARIKEINKGDLKIILINLNRIS